MAIGGFVGRGNEVKLVRDLVMRPAKPKGSMTIQSIEGPGGVGKSSILWQALDDIDLESEGYLTLKIEGASREIKRTNGTTTVAAIDQIINTLIGSATGTSIIAKPPGYYFPHTNAAIAAVNQLRVNMNQELQKKGIDLENIEHVKRLLLGGADVVDKITTLSPKLKEYLDPDGFNKIAGGVDDAAIHLKSLHDGSVYFWEKLGLGSSSTIRESAKKDPDSLLAGALVADLIAILLGEHKGSQLQPGHGKIKGLEKLLLIVEDYEALYPILDNFLVTNFLRLLKTKNIHTTIVILGRFKLTATNPIWKDFAKETERRIIVRALTEADVSEMLNFFDVDDAQERARIWEETRGHPYHITLWIEELEDGGRSSTTLMEMYKRITMWMTPDQIDWLHTIIFMDDIRVDTLEKTLENPAEASAAYAWFETEGSILEMGSNPPQMLQFVRSRLQEYLKNRNHKVFSQLQDRVKRGLSN